MSPLCMQITVSIIQNAIKTSHGRRPPGTSSGRPPGTSAGRIGTGRTGTAGARPITGMADGVNRPMTGIRGAGFPGQYYNTFILNFRRYSLHSFVQAFK